MHHLNYTYTVEAAQWTADKLKYINLIWKYVLGTNVLTVDGSLTVFFFFQMTGTSQQTTKTPQVHIPAATAAGNTSVSATLDPQAQLESDKRAVYR